MSAISLTPEQRRLVEQAGDRPVRFEDPEMQESFVLMRADVYERNRDRYEATEPLDLEIPEGIRRSQEAFFRDLPGLLEDRKLRGKYVAYHREERVKIGRSDVEVIRECLRRGYSEGEFDVFIIEPQSPEPEEIDYPSAWYDL